MSLEAEQPTRPSTGFKPFFQLTRLLSMLMCSHIGRPVVHWRCIKAILTDSGCIHPTKKWNMWSGTFYSQAVCKCQKTLIKCKTDSGKLGWPTQQQTMDERFITLYLQKRAMIFSYFVGIGSEPALGWPLWAHNFLPKNPHRFNLYIKSKNNTF